MRVERVMPLARKTVVRRSFRIFSSPPECAVVVHHHVMPGRVALLEIIQHLFLGCRSAPALRPRPTAPNVYLARLEHNVAIRQNDCRAPGAQMRNGVERAGVQPVGKRIVHQK